MTYHAYRIDSINGRPNKHANLFICPATVRVLGESLRLKVRVVLDCRYTGTWQFYESSCNRGTFLNCWAHWRSGYDPTPDNDVGYTLTGFTYADTFPYQTTSILMRYMTSPNVSPVSGDSLLFSWQQPNGVGGFWNTYTIRVDSLAGYIAGPATVAAGTTATWQLVPDWSASGYEINWTLAGSPVSGDDTVAVAIAGSGAKTLRAEYFTTSGAVQVVEMSISPRVWASISGPTVITAAGTYEFAAGETHTPDATASYSWWRVDQGTNATTYLGSGASVNVIVEEGSPSFDVSVLVSASGYSSNTDLKSVEVSTSGCGGQACLRAPASPERDRRKRAFGILP
ncbi:MAG: hypothetical protein HYX65_05880 [Gemmatimonadetes bacterium]|nr:hypothetical protein [Gemmatimonadota bacterium]